MGLYSRRASITENGVDYYGSGYLLNALSQATRGLHFETHLKTWDVISEELAYSTVARLDSLNVNVVADSGSGSLFEMREVAPEPNDPVRPHFFIGASNAKTKLDFNVVAKFEDFSQQMSKQTTSFISIDTSGRFPIIGEMLGWEKLQDYFQTSSSDTLSIVNLALEYNLLCDYTALIALEPKTDTPAQNPTNGQGGGSSAVKSHKETQTAIVFSAYPNPFNPQTTFYLSLRGASAVKIIIYNLLGQQIRTLSLDGFPGDNTIVWDGKDSSGRMVPSGVYFAQVMVTETTDNITFRKILKLVMLK